jgi:predicted ATP-grasp superfamily ATP-dependent carboligase
MITLRDSSLPVVVLKLDNHGALGAVRSLGRLGVAVYGVHSDAHAPALRSRYCRDGFTWDLDQAPAAGSVQFLLKIARNIGGRAILLPTNDETALFEAENADRLRQCFIFPARPLELVRALYSKKAMHSLARQMDIPTAETVFPACRADVECFAGSARFPVVLKASDGITVARRSGRKMAICRGKQELLENYDQMEDPARPALMLQEYIPGGEDSVWMFNGYFDENSECLAAFTGKKLRQTPVYTGMTSLGICLPNPQVEQMTKAFMKRIGYRGILDIGYRYDARDGLYKVLDINPRMGATFRLFAGDNGMDVVRAMYLHLSGQPVPWSRLREGRKWLVEDLDLVSSIKYYRDGVLGVSQWLRSFRGVRETAWYASDDMAPFWQMCGEFARTPFRKVAGRLQKALAMTQAA